ncbi:urea transporter [Raineyella antarctica]|uniref:Urea transporter n=1 Tax=Raineyella antarctica TaxID=1577474 RepID=A0A1G6HMA6_9ACTN|nr:urea transporter [Raineyella antarctica]SDB95324.1 urea transporter [Raineyella antarctica]
MPTTVNEPIRTPALDTMLDVLRAPFPGAGSNIALRWVDRVLRGTGQVVFQGNWLTGLFILVAIGINSRVYLVAALVGVVASTGTALLLRMDRGLVDAGLCGFNGVLLGIGLNAYLSQDFTAGQWPDALLYVYIVVGAAMTTVMLAAISSLLGSRKVPALTAPFVFTAWMFIFATLQFGDFHPGPLLQAILPSHLIATEPVTIETWYEGTFKGIAEIFFQDNALSGIVIVIGIALNSRVSALMGLLGSLSGVAVALLYGASETPVALGLYGFNAALTAMALGGVFFVLNRMGALYTLFGTLVTVWAWATMSVLLSPLGMPTFTSAFVIVGWFFILAKAGFLGVVPIDPADSTYPEDNLRRWRGGRLSDGR